MIYIYVLYIYIYILYIYHIYVSYIYVYVNLYKKIKQYLRKIDVFMDFLKDSLIALEKYL